jgi:predicted Zn-dependent protease
VNPACKNPKFYLLALQYSSWPFVCIRNHMMRAFTFFIAIFLLGCDMIEGQEGGTKSKKMTYSYACLDSAVGGSEVNKVLEKGGDLLRGITVSEKSITDEVQTEWGKAFHEDAIKSGTFKLLDDPAIASHLEKVMSDLLKEREDPTSIKYMIYPLDDSTINAFTFGGRIYVTKAMYERCKASPALLYAIVGHEIGHSEKGHIKKTIQSMMLSEKIFGEENGATAYYIQRLLTGSFNQKNELEADYYGTDLTYRLNQDICAAVKFWREMSTKENQYNRLEDFFRTHPFSNLRAECLKAHILTNFQRQCD